MTTSVSWSPNEAREPLRRSFWLLRPLDRQMGQDPLRSLSGDYFRSQRSGLRDRDSGRQPRRLPDTSQTAPRKLIGCLGGQVVSKHGVLRCSWKAPSPFSSEVTAFQQNAHIRLRAPIHSCSVVTTLERNAHFRPHPDPKSDLF